MAADGVALARPRAVDRNRRRRIGANVRAALAFGHAHANSDGLLLLPGSEARVVAPREQLRQYGAGEGRLMQEGSHGGVGHGDRTAMAGLHLRRHIAAGTAGNMGPRPWAARREIVPG